MTVLVGNDVVDLRPARGKAGDGRFVERVFRPEEQRLIRDAPDPDLVLWSLWAAKEAAYKVAAKLDRRAVFAHREHAVEVPGAGPWVPGARVRAGTVRSGTLVVGVSWEVGPGWVHAVAATREPGGWRSRVASLGSRPESEAVRTLAAALLEEAGFPGATVVRARAVGAGLRPGPPVALRDGAPIPGLDVSLSHDGGFVAAVVLAAAPSPGSAWR